MGKYKKNDDRDDDKLFKNASMDDYDDDGDDAEEDDGEQGGGASALINGGAKVGKAVLKVAKNTIKLIGNIIKLISKLPPVVQAVIYAILLALIISIVVIVTTAEASDEVNTSVNTTVSGMNAKLEDETLPQEEKDKIQKAVDHFEKENSYLYFRISDINDAYENYKNEYDTTSEDVGSRAYPSLSTEYGTTELDDTTSTSRLVDADQKQPLFKHLLMTEKYNFNKVKWKWYSHSHDGTDLNTASFKEDKELGVRYPADHNSTELETFIKLLSPYMQTWHIPLAAHSAILTKDGSSEIASKFTYSVIKNTYSDIIVNRYDIQKYILNTKYDDYMRREYKSKFTRKIEVTRDFVPQIESREYEIESVTETSAPAVPVEGYENRQALVEDIIPRTVDKYLNDHSNYRRAIFSGESIDRYATFSGVSDSGDYYAITNSTYASTDDGTKVKLELRKYYIDILGSGSISISNSFSADPVYVDPIATLSEVANNAIDNYISTHPDEQLYKGKYNSDGTINGFETFLNVPVSNEYTCIYSSLNYSANMYTLYTKKYNVELRVSQIIYRTDESGNRIYDATCSYKYLHTDITYEQQLLNERYDNTRKEGDPLTVDKASDSVPIVPLKEDFVSSQTNIKNKYYIKEAKTFDVKFVNAFNYIKYSEEDAANRVNPKSEKETNLLYYYDDENIENKIDSGNINHYINVSRTLRDVENDPKLVITNNHFKNAHVYAYDVNETYEKLRDLKPDEVRTFETTTVYGNLNPDGVSYTSTTTYTNKYEAANTYVKKEGKPENNQGTHYLTRMWEDSLTQSSAKKDLYTVEDLVEFNADYNSKLNGTDKATEKTEYEKILDKDYNSKSDYSVLEIDQKLNNIYFINSNYNIFEEYMVDESPTGPATGYNNEWLKFVLSEIKNLFAQTEDETGKIPYVYGISLGLTNLLEDTSRQQLNSGSGIFGWPADNPYISAIQGYSTVYGEEHGGVDIWATYDGDNHDYSAGQYPAYAIADGEVIVASDLGIASDSNMVDSNKLGNYIVIKHDNGYISSYGHLFTGTFTVSTGDRVKRGDEIAKIGSSGNSTCLHIHFNIYNNSDGDNTYDAVNDKLDPLEFYRVEPTEANVNKIEYNQLLQDASLRDQIDKFNMYQYVGSVGSGDVIQEGEPLPTVTEAEKQELLSNLSSNGKYYSEELAQKGCWLLEYYRDNSIELLARVMNCEINSAPETEAGIYLISAQLKATMNGLESRKSFTGKGKAENIYELIQSGYFSPYNLGEGDLFYQEPPQFYRKLAAAALDGVLPNPPGFTGNEKQWTGSSDKMSNSQIQTNYNSKNTVGYAVSSLSWHVFTLNSEPDPNGIKLIEYDSYDTYLKLNEAYGESVSGIEGVYSATPLTSNISEFEEVLARY